MCYYSNVTTNLKIPYAFNFLIGHFSEPEVSSNAKSGNLNKINFKLPEMRMPHLKKVISSGLYLYVIYGKILKVSFLLSCMVGRCLHKHAKYIYINMLNIFTGWTKSFLSHSCFLFQLWFQFLSCWDFLLNERSGRQRRVNDMIYWVLVFYFFHVRNKCYQMLLVSWMVEWFNDAQTNGCSPFFLMIWALSIWGPSEKEWAVLK